MQTLSRFSTRRTALQTCAEPPEPGTQRGNKSWLPAQHSLLPLQEQIGPSPGLCSDKGASADRFWGHNHAGQPGISGSRGLQGHALPCPGNTWSKRPWKQPTGFQPRRLGPLLTHEGMSMSTSKFAFLQSRGTPGGHEHLDATKHAGSRVSPSGNRADKGCMIPQRPHALPT